MEALANKVNEALGAKATVSTTTDQRRALEGADFVIVTISTGGFDSMAVDIDVPARHGIRQSVGDSVGPGGINRALRNVPVLVGIGPGHGGGLPRRLAPQHHQPHDQPHPLRLRETSRVKTVGLCHEVGNWCLDLAIALGKPAEAIRPTVVGVNHFPVVTALDVDGTDGFEILADDGRRGRGPRGPGPPPRSPRGRDVLAARLRPAPPAEAHPARPLGGRSRPPATATSPSSSRRCSPRSRAGARPSTSSSPRSPGARSTRTATSPTWTPGWPGPRTSRPGSPASCRPRSSTRCSPAPAGSCPVNIPNAGQCPDLPADAVVESICVVDGDGITGPRRGPRAGATRPSSCGATWPCRR